VGFFSFHAFASAGVRPHPDLRPGRAWAPPLDQDWNEALPFSSASFVQRL
jgi:hypothetical protein